jgi:hypothetical protein
MKLDRTALAIAATTALLALAGCASSARPPEAPLAPACGQVATAALTSAEASETESAPRVGKPQHGLDGETQFELDPKRAASHEGKHSRAVFGGWK